MARKAKFDYDIIVIGSGASGNTTAILTAHAGKKVALVEADAFGGESSNWGDIPTAAMLHVAHLYDEARHGTKFGLRSSMLSYNFPSLLGWKDKVAQRTGASDGKKFYEKQGIDTYEGLAHFLSPHEITVNRRHLTAEYFVIATGSHFAPPDVLGIDTIPYLTPKTIFEQKRIPRSIFIMGGDSVAIEYAQLFATFGTKVYISEVSSRLLPSEDLEVGELIEKQLENTKGITCLTQSQVVSVGKKGLGVHVIFTRGNVTKSVQVDELLVTTNRRPNTDIGLENASVVYTPRGIDVNANLRTSANHIYAAGTVLGDDIPTHVALMQGRVVAHNVVNKDKIFPDYTATPRVTYTNPAIASVGLTEDDCIKRDLPINKALVPLSMIPRSNTSDFRDGFVKLIADKKGVLLGGTIVSPAAPEMIHEIALALHHGMSAHDLATTPHAFLSWSEAIRVAANKLG